MAATAQLNVRMDTELKASGDAALASLGVTPSEAVRGLWRLAAEHEGRPDALQVLLFPDQAASEQDARVQDRERKLALATAGLELYPSMCEKLGAAASDGEDVPSDDELEEYAYAEKYGDFMGWTS